MSDMSDTTTTVQEELRRLIGDESVQRIWLIEQTVIQAINGNHYDRSWELSREQYLRLLRDHGFEPTFIDFAEICEDMARALAAATGVEPLQAWAQTMAAYRESFLKRPQADSEVAG